MKKKSLLVLGIVCAILCVVALVLNIYLSSNTSLVADTGIQNGGQQNNVIQYDEANNILFIGTRTGSIFAFDNSTHAVMWEMKADSESPITTIKCHPDTGHVFAGSDDNHIYIVDMQTGAVLNNMDIQRRVLDLDVSADETLLAATVRTNNKSNVMVFDLTTGETIANTSFSYPQKNVLFTSDASQIIVADRRGQVQRLEYDCTPVAAVKGLNSEIVSLKTDGNGQYLAVDVRGNYLVFDENCNVLRSGAANMIEGAEPKAGNFDAAGNVIIGTRQGYLYVLNAEDKQIYTARQANGLPVSDFATDGEVMYITGYGDYIERVELASLETIAALQSMAFAIQLVMIAALVLSIVFFLLYFSASYKLLCRIGHALWKFKVAYILLIPTFVLLILFNYTPMVIALSRAFTNWSSTRSTAADYEFVGLYNFKRMFTEGYFLIGVKNMLILMLTGFIKSLTMPILAAWLVYSFGSDRKRYAYRFLFVLPIVVPGLVGSLLWKQIYNPGGGLDQILTALGLESWIHVWLGEEKTALWSIVFMGPPYIGTMPFLLYYGGFTSIDSSLYEAARIDGASRWKIFWRIQIPMVRPQMKLLIMLQFIGSIQDYGGVYLLTGGGPGVSTYVPGLELYYNATRFGNYGYACAMGLVMFIFIMIGTFFNNKIKAENYNG